MKACGNTPPIHIKSTYNTLLLPTPRCIHAMQHDQPVRLLTVRVFPYLFLPTLKYTQVIYMYSTIVKERLVHHHPKSGTPRDHEKPCLFIFCGNKAGVCLIGPTQVAVK